MLALTGAIFTASAADLPFWRPSHTLTDRTYEQKNVYNHKGYPLLVSEIATLFDKELKPDSLLELWDGSKRTAHGHMDWLLGEVKV